MPQTCAERRPSTGDVPPSNISTTPSVQAATVTDLAPADRDTPYRHGPTAVNAAKVRCDHGHLFDAENTYWRPGGGRACRECQRGYVRDYRRRKREQALGRTGMAAAA